MIKENVFIYGVLKVLEIVLCESNLENKLIRGQEYELSFNISLPQKDKDSVEMYNLRLINTVDPKHADLLKQEEQGTSVYSISQNK